MITVLPIPVTNNAVAWRQSDLQSWAYSLLGLGPSKHFSEITNSCFVFSSRSGQWAALPQMDDLGRIAATSQRVGNKLCIFGGYTVGADGSEHTSSSVNIYNLRTDKWSHGAAIPVPVDDAVSAAYLDRYVYLISGWSETGSVNNVQLYDTTSDHWLQATAIPDARLFGHCGSIVGRTLYCFDGVSDAGHRFAMSSCCWSGVIDPVNPCKINWSELAPHPNKPRYRAAAGVVKDAVIICGGASNPYNYDGIGYDGQPSTPENDILILRTASKDWRVARASGLNMDHRGLVKYEDDFYIIGGMDEKQMVSPQVLQVPEIDRF